MAKQKEMDWATFYELWDNWKIPHDEKEKILPPIVRALISASFFAYEKAGKDVKKQVHSFLGWDGEYKSTANIDLPHR